MENNKISRRAFTRNTGLITTASMFMPSVLPAVHSGVFKSTNNSINISTDFKSGGGAVKLQKSDPLTILVIPHNQRNGGWSQVWWYFLVSGLTPGQEITILLDMGNPKIEGINPKIKFTYDRQDWGLTNTGKMETVDGKEFFVYKHIARGEMAWFAYDLPYTPEHMDAILVPKANRDSGVEVIELCRSIGNHPVKALRFDHSENGETKYGIWLQARAHAFESGSSWVLHELTNWLFSGNPKAIALRNCAQITVIPIVDVDSVLEGRTGKMQVPYDHNRGWDNEPGHWPEIRIIKSKIKELALQNKADLFIDFHGPGNRRHPYFIIPEAKDLPSDKQRENRAKFLNILNAKPFDEELNQTQSMTQLCYSARPWNQVNKSNSSSWVTMNSTESNVALTLEVNMNTPLSTREGYRAEGVTLGKAMSDYFAGNYHQK